MAVKVHERSDDKCCKNTTAHRRPRELAGNRHNARCLPPAPAARQTFRLVGSWAPTRHTTTLGNWADGVSWPGGRNTIHIWPPKKEGACVNARPSLKPAWEAAFRMDLHVNRETSGQRFHVRRHNSTYALVTNAVWGLHSSSLSPGPPQRTLCGESVSVAEFQAEVTAPLVKRETRRPQRR